MKTILGCLLCLVLGTAQTFAIKGGPDYGSRVTTTGTYAGVLAPNAAFNPGVNSIGLFSLTIPKTNLGSGNVIIFIAGETYTGTLQGTADPDSAKLTGEIAASFPYVVFLTTYDKDGNPSTTSQTVAATAAGPINGFIRANKNIFSTAATRISGTSDLQFSLTVNNPFTEIQYVVSGFKQASL